MSRLFVAPRRYLQLVLALLFVGIACHASAASSVYISEFLASNDTSLADEDGARPDWIELFNGGDAAENLNGWALTDSASNLRKWSFPSVTIPPNGFIVVFASGKDRRNVLSPLHTNFRLSSSGGYLALVRPDGSKATEFNTYPAQYPDKPYGYAQSIATTQLIGPASTVRVRVPVDGALGTSWTARNFSDSSWASGSNGVGYVASVSGWKATYYKANSTFGNTAGAESVVANPSLQSSKWIGTLPVINFFNSGGEGRFGNNINPQPLVNSGDIDHYVVEATGTISIPTSGVYTFGVNSDDGFELHIGGNRITGFDGGRGPGDTLQSVNLAAGEYPIRVMIYEIGGGSGGELFAAAGGKAGWDSSFRLVGDSANGGLVVRSPATVESGNLASFIKTDLLASMSGQQSSAYLRYPFNISDPAALTSLTMPIRYEDGFVAYLNGVEVARRNAPEDPLAHSSLAATDRSPGQAQLADSVDLSDARSLLVSGANVLAIHGLNEAISGNEFLIMAELAQYTATAGALGYFATPTPGAFNTAAPFNKVGPVTASVGRGFYSAPQTVALNCATPGATIRYTFDGSTPTLASPTAATYSSAISISKTTTLRYAAFKSGSEGSDVVTQTYIFVSDVMQQSPNGAAPVVSNPPGAAVPQTVWPTGPINGQVLDYGIDQRIVNHITYGPALPASFRALPTFSIVTDLAHLFDPSTGIYSNPYGDERVWERPASLELIQPNGTSAFQVNCGLRIRGGFSRSTDNPKHAFRFFFRDEYGAGKLRYPLFGTSGAVAQEFDKFDLRTSQNYSWSFQGDSRCIFIRDVFSRRTQRDMGQVTSHGGFYHLYVNGQYWGMFNIDERPEASFGATYFGGTSEEYDTIKVAPDDGYRIYATDGDLEAWRQLWDLANLDLTNSANYQRMLGNNADGTRNSAYPVLLDPANLIDYNLCIYWSGNFDAAISAFLGNERPNNWFGVRSRIGTSGGFKFVVHDSEHTLLDQSTDRLGPWNAGDPTKPSQLEGPLSPPSENAFRYSSPQYIFQRCILNSEFRALFADRLYRHISNGGALSTASSVARFDALAAEIDGAVVAESARWGDAKSASPLTRDNWLTALSGVRNGFIRGVSTGIDRTSVLLGQLRSKGWYPAVNPPVFNQRGGSVPGGFNVTLTNPNGGGTIYYTIDGTDPRLPGGALNTASARTYLGSAIVVNSAVTIRVRVRNGSTWSPLDEATFYPAQDFTRLVFTEIHYNPLPSANAISDEYELIELKNASNNPLELSGLQFTAGVDFTFPANTVLPPGGFWVIARNATRFTERYGFAPSGQYTGRLDNGGERLVLSHVLGAVVADFAYRDSAPWPVAPDGHGFSLVSRDPHSNSSPGEAGGWRASKNSGGSPGADDSEISFPPIVINEVLANTSAGLLDSIELYNPGNVAADIGNWWLSDDAAAPAKYRIPPGTILPAGGYIAFTQAQFAFGLASTGDDVYLSSGDAAGSLSGYSHGFAFGATELNRSLGRLVNSVGEEMLVRQSARTFGVVNAGPAVGPVVLNEIMYRPTGSFDEYIEIRNITDQAVPLYDPANPANTWKIAGVGFTFPTGVTLAAGQYALIVPIDPQIFRSKYAVAADVPIYGPYSGQLQDDGERLALEAPQTPTTASPPVIPYAIVDAVRYSDRAPWPLGASGSGQALQRINSLAFADDPVNWAANGATPGKQNAPNQPPTVRLTSPAANSVHTLPTVITLTAEPTDPDGAVLKVEFYDGSNKIGEAYGAPWTYAWSNAGTGTHQIKARVIDSSFADAESTPVTITVNPFPIGNGTGLRGDYFNTIELTGTPVSRVDAQVNLFTGYQPPAGVSGTNMSVRWTGQVLPRHTATYTFHTISDDGVRLYVNNVEVISNWTFHGPVEDVGFIQLNAGQLYDIRMEFFQGSGGAVAQLFWSADAAGLEKQLIPQTQLYPPGAPRIVQDPRQQSVERGRTAVFSVLAAGTAPLRYQWRKNATDIAGATSAALTLPDVLSSDAATYSVVVTNDLDTVTSSGAGLAVTFTDSDGDGIPNWWETSFALNPFSFADAALDSDSDGANHREEYLAGTDPRDPLSRLSLAISRSGSTAVLRFTAQSNKSYAIFYKDSFSATTWSKLQDIAPLPGVRSIEVSDSAMGARQQRFYRVVTQ